MKAPRRVSKKEKQDHRNKQDPDRQIFHHGLGRVMDQVAAVKERHDLNPRWKDMLVSSFTFA